MESGGGGAGGGAADMFGSSTAPLTWHDFLERMRHPSAADFVKSIKSFIVSFSNKVPDPEKDSAAVQEFLASMEGAFRNHMLWANSSEEELESAGEGLEKYVMTKLFSRAFAALPEDVKKDEDLSEKIALVQQFIRPENLDIKPQFQNETSWLLAQKELQKINMYKAPRDKLICILNCCKVINNLLLNASITSNDQPPGADEFLPVLIYVTIKANPPQLHSNLLYIQRYRRQSRLVSEAAYYFTNILSAESFIWDIDAKSLSMDETEFQSKMDSAKAHLLGLPSNTEIQRNPANKYDLKFETPRLKRDTGAPQDNVQSKGLDGNDMFIKKSPSVFDLEKKGAADILKDERPSKYFQDFPFLFAHAGDLTVDDVERLLNNYKQLVFKYVSLCKGLGTSTASTSASSMDTQEKVDSSKNSVDDIEAEMMKLELEGLKRNDETSEKFVSDLEDTGSKLVDDVSVSRENIKEDV